MLDQYLAEAAIAAGQARRLILLVVIPEGIKVTAPAFGRVTREIVVPWVTLNTCHLNPLLYPIAELNSGY